VNPPFPSIRPDNVHRPKISVILSVQNAASRIGGVIESIRAQTFTDWELIIVVSGSADNTSGTVASYVNSDERIRVVDANGSLTEARYIGLLRARGRYIYCLDANHCSLPDTLQRLCECLETQPGVAVAYGALDSLRPNSSPLNAFKRLGTDDFLNTGTVAIRRSALNAALADSHCDVEDSSSWWLLLSNGSAAFVGGMALSITNALPSACSIISNGASAPEINHTPFKLAYLIVAHHQPKHLNRLIRALNQEVSYFFIHIDAKAHLPSFQAVVSQFDNVIFVSNRVTVEWSKFSVVQAVLNLIQAAVISGHSFRYFTLLSGADYPVKHRQVIATRLLNSNRQYMRIDRRLTRDPENTHGYLLRNLPPGRYFGNMIPYHGSMYWSLTADCIRFMLDFINRNPGYLDVHRHVSIPDEVFFHTLVKHSPFADAITHDFSAGSYPNHTHHGNHFIDWAGLRKRDYLTLHECDFEDLLTCDALFARKFDEYKSSKLLDLLDIYVHCCDLQREPAQNRKQLGSKCC
jgi:Core-2/I-Branching enzyme/Glycosyl transferase family 2